ncbi:MAG: phosphonate C-P lyase system protein PhnG [Desulfosoma sp.]|uniref:phosphonate C-P lyase system protein PhnG n=1 Tax=Desulfosoma sp. TaxID=2603217 RepID=UPI00404AA533
MKNRIAADALWNDEERRQWMSVLAEAETDDLEALWDRLQDKPSYTVLHGPETGLIMVQARIGTMSGLFYLGEATVTKCFVTFDGQGIGASFILGRRPRHAEIAAVLDAMLQDPSKRGHLMASIIRPLDSRRQEAERLEAARAASTRVEFFTMVRGE